MIEAIANALPCKRTSNGGLLTNCLAHDDRNPSLSVDPGDNGSIVVKCHSGCSQEAVINELKARGLWHNGQGKALSKEDLEQARKRAEQRKAERQKKYDEKAALAQSVYSKSSSVLLDHPYLARKLVKPTPTMRELDLAELVKLIGYHPQANDEPFTNGRVLIIPVVVDGRISTLEMIDENGLKSALAGGRKADGYWATDKLPGGDGEGLQLQISEGVVTGISSFEANNILTIAALSCGNLPSTARQMRRRYPKADIIIMADLVKITGKPDPHAVEAAKEIGGKLAIPDFGPSRPEGMTDFNDMAVSKGPAAVKACIEAAAVMQTPATVATVATVVVAEWPEPSSLTTHQLADPYPLDSLPGTIGAAVAEVVGFVQCPVALGACSALTVVSMAAQGFIDVRRAAKLEGPTSLFVLAIADSGERKTTIDGFFSKPVQQWEAEQAEAAKPDLTRYEIESQAWEAKKSGKLAAIKESSKRGEDTSDLEEELARIEAEKPIQPKVPRLLFSDATPEALTHRLAHGWPVGGVLSSEAGVVFGGHAMSKESAMRNMSMLNSLWGAEPLTIDRRSSPSYTVRGARLTMGLAVQSETVRAFLDSSKGLARGIGWLARFLIAWPESTQGNRMYQDPPEYWPHLAKFHRRLGALLDLPLPLDDMGELSPVMLELSPEAKVVWVAFHDEVEEELGPGRDMAEARDVASKAADNAARLAALFHLFENGIDGTIGANHMQAATSLVTWHLYEARRFIGEIALPVEINNSLRLDDWLLEHCRMNRVGEVATRTIQQMGPVCVRDRRILDNALEELVDAGRVQVVKDGRRKLVKINPALLGG